MTVLSSLNGTIVTFFFFFHIQTNKMEKNKYREQKDRGLYYAHVDRWTMAYLYNLLIHINKAISLSLSLSHTHTHRTKTFSQIS